MNKRTFTPDEINRLLNSLATDDPLDLGGGLTATRTARGLSSLDKGDPPGFRIDKDGKWGGLVEDSSPEELAAISTALWEKGKEFFPDDAAPDKTPKGWAEKDARFVCKDTACGRLCLRKDLCPENCDLLARNLAAAAEKKRIDDLTPEGLREVPDPLEGTPEGLTPLALRDVPDREDLEPDPLGLTPDSLREKKDPFEGTIEALTPNCLRDIIRDPGLARRLALGKGTADDLLTPESLKGE
jgi:hypothetical protein